MLHLFHMIQRRYAGRPVAAALPLLLVAAVVLLAGLGLLLVR